MHSVLCCLAPVHWLSFPPPPLASSPALPVESVGADSVVDVLGNLSISTITEAKDVPADHSFAADLADLSLSPLRRVGRAAGQILVQPAVFNRLPGHGPRSPASGGVADDDFDLRFGDIGAYRRRRLSVPERKQTIAEEEEDAKAEEESKVEEEQPYVILDFVGYVRGEDGVVWILCSFVHGEREAPFNINHAFKPSGLVDCACFEIYFGDKTHAVSQSVSLCRHVFSVHLSGLVVLSLSLCCCLTLSHCLCSCRWYLR